MKEHGRSGDTRDDSQDKAFSVIDRRPVFQDETSAALEPRYPSVVEELKVRTEEAERRAREISAAYRRIEEEREAFRVRLARDLERRVEIARVEMARYSGAACPDQHPDDAAPAGGDSRDAAPPGPRSRPE